MCNDRHHVLFNHVETPFLVKQDLGDPNAEHNNRPSGHHPLWGADGSILAPPEFAARVLSQARTLIEHHATRSELGAAFPTFYVWIAHCATHASIYDDPIWFRSRLGMPGDAVTLREWVERFVEAPRSGGTAWRIDGADGMASGCPAT